MSFDKTNNWLKLILAFTSIIWLGNNLNAQTYAVGNTSVSADVGQLGNATASIPIYCPSGRLGIKPQVSLTFNSQANSGILGKGWNITGMSVISRSGSNWHIDNGVQETVKLNGNDKLTLDGQRLLLVQGSPTSFFTNGNIFRTEIDQFVQVVYKNSGGNEYFEVDTKDGGKVFYGYTADSKHKPVGSSNTLGWYITRSYDKNGNYMEYVYDNANGQILLKQIKYTGYDATFYGTKTSSVSQEIPFNKVEFEYENASYEGNQFINGEKIIQNKRLHHIITYADATIARTYWMNYTSNEINSYLTKVTEQSGNGELMKPIEITWTADATDDKTRIKKVIDSELYPNKYYGDFDGNGTTDILMVSGILNPLNGQLLNSPNFRIINSNGFEIKRGVIGGWNISSITVGDLNADGTDDLLLQNAYIVKSGADRPNFDICYDDYDRFKLDRIKYNYFLWDTKTASVIQSDLLTKEYIQSTDYSVTSPATPVGVPVINPNYNGYFTDEAQLWKFLHVEPVLVDMDGDGKLDVVLKEMWAKRVIGATTWCDDVERTEVTSDDGYIINLSIYPSSTNLINKNYLSQKITLTGSGNRISNFVPLDFNGNGKIDFMIIYNNNTTSILEYNSTTNTLGHIYGNGSYSFPTTDYHKYLKTGDFNGDGKTDLLYFHMTQPYNNNNSINNWYVAYSNGVGFNEYVASDIGVSHNINPSSCIQPTINKMGFILDVGDFNGDGKSDIIERHHHENVGGHIGNSIFIYYSKGLGFKETQVLGSHDSPLPVTGSASTFQYYDLEKTTSADFDGDGKCDQLLFSGQNYLGWDNNFYTGNPATNVVAILIESFKSMNFKLTKLSYSDKHNVDFEYSLLNDGSRKNYSILGKCLVITAPIYVVNSMTTSITGLSSKTYNYSYGNLLLNKHGRGVMGFEDLTIREAKTNGVPNINVPVTYNKYKQNSEFLYKLDIDYTANYLVPNGGIFDGNNLISKTVYNNTSIKTTSSNTNINFFYVNFKTETNYLTGLKKTTCIEYDENGNMVYTQEVFDKLGNATGVAEFTNTSNFKYNQYGSWLPSSLTISRNCKVRNGSTPHYTQTEMDYWTNGNLKHTEYFKNNLSYYYKEMVNYDKYGNITNTSVDTANNATTNTFKNKYFTYTNGRFLQKVKNALNQETQYVYEPVYGNKLSEQGPSGLTTTYQYDNWGKLIRTDFADGNFETISFNWATTNTDNIYYYTVKSNSLGNMSWEYYNALDQKVMYKEKGFEGKIATQKFTYNSDNLPETETNLYDATSSTTITDTKKTTEYTYDKYKRKETVKYNNVLMATYIYTYGTTKTTIIDGKNREKYSILNATGLVETSGDNGGIINYKYGSHNQVLETTTNGNTIFTDYNVQLNKISMTDPNTGTILYDYNAFGELIGQKDAKNFIYYYKYDELGRLIQKWGGNDVYSYTYYSTLGNASVNQLQKEEFKINGVSKHKKEYTYTTLGKLSSVAETVNNQVYTTNYYYKSTNQQLLTVSYPAGINLNYSYDDFNNLKKILDQNNKTLWTKNSEAIDGKLTSESFGNQFTTYYTYDTHRQLSEINSINYSNSQVALRASYIFELQTGNLLHRFYNEDVTHEQFEYDNLDRLTQITEEINTTNNIKTYNFAANGNITSIENGGTHTLEYEDSRPHAVAKHKFENVNQTVPASSIDLHDYVYTTFDKIAHIEQNGVATLDVEYGLDQQRISMHVLEYGSPSVETYYINSANLEIKNGVSYTYLYAEGKPFAIYNGTTDELVYLHLDYQGSLMAITRDNGQILEQRSYDAWGRPRDPITWSYNIGMAFGGAGEGITMRGYTMHEHLEMFSLINMNGRLYDPVLGRMLSPDNYIQAPDNTQSYNRYSYCVNNPLKYTDPSGNTWGQALGILIGAYAGGVVSNGGETNPTKWNYNNPGTYLGIGLGGFVGYMYTPGTEFKFSASYSGITLPLGRYVVGQGIHFGFEEKYFGGKLGGGFAFKQNRKNSGGDLTMNDDYRTLVQSKIKSSSSQDDLGEVYASIDVVYQNIKRDIHVINNYRFSVYFKPDDDITINGVTYLHDGAYEIKPGEFSEVPIDGLNVNGVVIKFTDGYNYINFQPNGKPIPHYTSSYNEYGFFVRGGIKLTPPDRNWDNLFNINR